MKKNEGSSFGVLILQQQRNTPLRMTTVVTQINQTIPIYCHPSLRRHAACHTKITQRSGGSAFLCAKEPALGQQVQIKFRPSKVRRSATLRTADPPRENCPREG